jgi:hypothetical protein
MPTVVLSKPSLVETAQQMTVDELKWYLSTVLERLPARKGELVVRYLAALTDKATLQTLWNKLTPLQQQVVAEVAHSNTGLWRDEFLEAKYPGVKRPSNARGYMGWGWVIGSGRGRQTPEPYDLFFIHNHEYGLYMPDEVAEVVRIFAPTPPAYDIRSSTTAPTVERSPKVPKPPEVFVKETERAVLHDLAATLFLIQQGKVAISATTKAPTLATVRLLRQRLMLDEYLPEPVYERADDASRPFALLMLVQAARWATPTGAGNKLELTKSGQALLPGPLEARHVKEAWERWLKTDMLDELARIKAIKGQQGKSTRLTKPPDRRKMIAAALGSCPTGRWIDLDDFLRYLRATSQLPDIERGTTTTLHLGSSAEYGWLGYADVRYWDIVTGSYIRALLWEYATTLGLLDIAYTWPDESVHDFGHFYGLDDHDYISRFDGFLGFRITPLGAYALGITDDYTPPEESTVAGPPIMKVLPNLDIVIVDAPNVAPGDRAMLERIGVGQSTNVYRLVREQMLDALESGLTLEQITVFLATRSGTAPDDFPQTVRVFLDDVRRRSTALRDNGKMIMIEGDDPMLLTEFAHSSDLRASVQLATVGERTVLLVPEDRETAVRRSLRKLGYIARKA